MVKEYTGTANITDARIKALNSEYTKKGYTSTKGNMQIVAYLLDINIWKIYATDKAEYAIGAPTIEMLLKSYSQSHNVNYKYMVYNDNGYQISNDGGSTYTNTIAGMLSTSDTLYVLPKGAANSMWVASPCKVGTGSTYIVESTGKINTGTSGSTTVGCRAVVCLNPDVVLKEVTGGFEIQ